MADSELKILRKTIGLHLHSRRMAKRLTLRKLSRLTGISIEKLDQYEMGKNQITLEAIYVLANYFEIKIEEFLKPFLFSSPCVREDGRGNYLVSR